MLCSLPFRADNRGVRVVTNVERNAVDVEALTGERRLSRTEKSCGPGAPMSGAKFATMLSHRAGDGGKWNGSPRRSRISRKTTAQGRPEGGFNWSSQHSWIWRLR